MIKDLLWALRWLRKNPLFTAAATAILDRFHHHAKVVVLSGDSYRLREARTQVRGPKTPSTDQPPRIRAAVRA